MFQNFLLMNSIRSFIQRNAYENLIFRLLMFCLQWISHQSWPQKRENKHKTPPSLSVARKKKKFKTKALHCVFIWCMDTLNPENEKNSMSLFWEIAISNLLPYKARSTTRGKITKSSTLHFDGIQVQTI